MFHIDKYVILCYLKLLTKNVYRLKSCLGPSGIGLLAAVDRRKCKTHN